MIFDLRPKGLKPLSFAQHDLVRAQSALDQGKLIHLPTETVYGLAGRADNAKTVADIYAAKGRPSFNPLIVHIGHFELARAMGVFDARAERLIDAFWPGPLTLVLPYCGDDAVCDLARAGLDSIALRCPAHPLSLSLLQSLDYGLVAPSANRSGRPSPTDIYAAQAETGDVVDLSLDGGACMIGLESSVLSLMGAPRLLRPGAVTRSEIEALIGPLEDDDKEGHRSPGRLTRHYAPKTPMIMDCTAPPNGSVLLAFGDYDYEGPVLQLSATRDVKEAAANLFSYIRKADATQSELICVAPIDHHGLGEAINDRLRRACGFIG